MADSFGAAGLGIASARARGGRCRRSSRRAGSCPTARSMPKFVPMPSSPSRRAPASVASIACRYSSPSSARADTTTPLAELQRDARRPRTPRGRRRDVEADAPLGGRPRRGPVKTSPDGMLRRPSELIQVRPATESVEVGPARPRSASPRRLAMRSISPACDVAQLAARRRPGRRGRGTARARTNAAKSAIAMPACCASAGVGHSVTHQRRASIASRTGARARAARAHSSGVDPRQRARVLRRVDPQRRVGAPRPPRSSSGANPSRCTSRAAAQNALVLPRQRRRAAAATPRARATPAGARAAAASAERRGAHHDLLARLRPRGSSRTAARRTPRDRSRRLQLREVLGQVLAQHVADPGRSACEAMRKRASSSFWRVIGSMPATAQRDRQPLEQELDARGARRPPATAASRPACRRTRAACRRSSSRAARARRRPASGTREVGAFSRLARHHAGGGALQLAAHVARQRIRVPRPGGRGLERRELPHRRARLLGVLVEGGVRRARRAPCARSRGRSRRSSR